MRKGGQVGVRDGRIFIGVIVENARRFPNLASVRSPESLSHESEENFKSTLALNAVASQTGPSDRQFSGCHLGYAPSLDSAPVGLIPRRRKCSTMGPIKKPLKRAALFNLRG
jgi:hypothetical protein